MTITKKTLITGFCATLLLSSLVNAESSQGLKKRYIVKYKNNTVSTNSIVTEDISTGALIERKSTTKSTVNKRKKRGRIAHRRSMSLKNHHVYTIEADNNQILNEELAAISSNPDVEFIEEDRMLRAFAAPNDPLYTDQWHYKNFDSFSGINMPQAWEKATGEGVIVAVLDTGYRPHKDLVDNLLPGYDMISDTFVSQDGDGRDSQALDPGDAMTARECGGGYPSSDLDSSWHGTHVAGTIAAIGNNSEGVIGVAYNAKVLPVRVLGKCGGYLSDIADGILWAAGLQVNGVPTNNNPAQVINMSLGGYGTCSSTYQSAISEAYEAGVTVVVAAGNSNDNANNYNPGNCDHVINVAASNETAQRASYSNYGSLVDVTAPGGREQNGPSGVLSTHNSGNLEPVDDSYYTTSGTSMATPHVAGVAALLLQADSSITPDEIKTALVATTNEMSDRCEGCGAGIINANAAIDYVTSDSTEPDLPSTGALLEQIDLSQVSGKSEYYSFEVSGESAFIVTATGGTGDADIYVYHEDSWSYDCSSVEYGNEESCIVDDASSGTWTIRLYAYGAFSGLTLKVEEQ